METTNHPEPAWILKRSSHDNRTLMEHAMYKIKKASE